MTTTLAQFAQDIATGALRVIDLIHTLSPDFPALQLPPQFGQVWAFKSERISHYDEAGPGWYWNNFSCGEHTGTHFDAPVHWVSGKDHPRNAVDTIAPRDFIAPGAWPTPLPSSTCARTAPTPRAPPRRPSSGSSRNATCAASSWRPSTPAPASPTPGPCPTPATPSCTAPTSSACSACTTWSSCRPPAPSSSPRR